MHVSYLCGVNYIIKKLTCINKMFIECALIKLFEKLILPIYRLGTLKMIRKKAKRRGDMDSVRFNIIVSCRSHY